MLGDDCVGGLRRAIVPAARLMPRRQKPPSQTWRTFLQNHLADLVSVDFLPLSSGVVAVDPLSPSVLANDRRLGRIGFGALLLAGAAAGRGPTPGETPATPR